jgi:hypothetical protein
LAVARKAYHGARIGFHDAVVLPRLWSAAARGRIEAHLHVPPLSPRPKAGLFGQASCTRSGFSKTGTKRERRRTGLPAGDGQAVDTRRRGSVSAKGGRPARARALRFNSQICVLKKSIPLAQPMGKKDPARLQANGAGGPVIQRGHATAGPSGKLVPARRHGHVQANKRGLAIQVPSTAAPGSSEEAPPGMRGGPGEPAARTR